MIRILFFEDNEDFIDGMTELISQSADIELCAVYRNTKDIIRHIEYFQPDIVLMDIDMPEQNGLEGLRIIRSAGIDCTVIMLTVFDDNDRVFHAIRLGALGYILKTSTPEKILTAIREANEGGAPITPSVAKQVLKLFTPAIHQTSDVLHLTTREHEVLNLLVQGFSYKMASSELKIGIETFRYHIKNIYSKLHVNSKSEAVAKALRNNIL
ncbi:MAG TPA: response regulator transcription factor [Chitinophagaceae bacterium]|nr:response regulator transcription factor [Chitinophagaceae bacterium]HNF72364.1 response regulator transcription factor [Chitinophagaceae bacterium]